MCLLLLLRSWCCFLLLLLLLLCSLLVLLVVEEASDLITGEALRSECVYEPLLLALAACLEGVR